MDLATLAGLFVTSFLAATILPMSSEAVLAGVALTTAQDRLLLWTVATVANTLGSVLNWSLGRWGAIYRDRAWFPVKPETYDKAAARFRRYGTWSLLFSWLPIVGDPLTMVAGALGVRFLPFVLLVAFGKGARYAVVLALF
ncbi:MAG: DedA family protein [Alphaproteobacteria bacterium]|nr:DedA family protein [Alphaproteobacteria bacterium]